MAFDKLSAADRIVACHVDIMKHSDFAQLGGLTQIGKVIVDATLPTAGTDGRDVYYGERFVLGLSRKQLRYLVLHENLHKALHHCTEYKDVCEKYQGLANQAMDYVVNQIIEDMDAGKGFVERPADPEPLIDEKYRDMSFIEVLSLLRKDAQQQPQQGKGGGKGTPMDEHMPGQSDAESDAESDTESDDEGGSLREQIQDAIAQGKIVSENLKRQRGEGAGSSSLGGFTERRTDWRKPLRRFVQEIAEGDDQSRYAPPNKRMLPLDVLLPSHFSESTGELIVACDTSGSMGGVYPLVFGEIAAICKSVNPSSVRVLWWDTAIAGEQVFKPADYDKIRTLMKPTGGGGTTVSCVAQHINAKRLKPRATILLSDGWIESSYETPPGPLLWGIVDNPRFKPLRGKVVHIQE